MSEYTWNNAAGGTFDDAGNWFPDTAYPGPNDTAEFAPNTTAGISISNLFTVTGDGTADIIAVSEDLTFTGDIAVIGPPPGSLTAFLVSGGTADFDGGSLLSLHEVQVGDPNGAGLLEFINGAAGTFSASDTSTAIDIGYDYDHQVNAGTVVVDGVSSVLTLYGGAYVGVFSPGTLNITDNGSVQVLASPASYDSFEAGSAPGSSGTIDVDTGGTLTVDEGSYIGNYGAGGASFNHGAIGYFNSYVVIGAAAAGTLNLANSSAVIVDQSLTTGTGPSVVGVDLSVLQVLGGIDIGGGGGSAYASVTDFGTIDDPGSVAGDGLVIATLGTLAVDATGALQLDQAATLDAGTLSALGDDTLPIALDVTGGTTLAPSAINGASGTDIVISQGITFAAGASANLLLGAAFDTSNVISNFASGDLLDVQINPIFYNNASYDVATNQLVLSEVAGAPLVLDVTNEGFSSTSFTTVPDGAGGTFVEVSPPCYVAGTNILTDHGQVPVEDLRIGDRLITRSGAARPVRWIGRRTYAPVFVAANPHLWPIRIAAGAIAEQIPARDLVVSPCHAIYFDHLLVPAASLVNGTTITRLKPAADLAYYHLELNTHDVILAEGAPAETYLDLGNRHMFQNAADHEVPPGPAPDRREYAPRHEQGPAVSAIRARLQARASALGHESGRACELRLDAPGVIRAEIPAGISALHLLSPAAFAAGDHRPLGALLRGLRLDGVRLPLTDLALLRGFHTVERHANQLVRWTNGDAVVTLVPTSSARWVEVDVIALGDQRRAA